MKTSPATLPKVAPAGERTRPPKDGATTSKNRLNFSTMNPKALIAIAVRTQARNVRSFALVIAEVPDHLASMT